MQKITLQINHTLAFIIIGLVATGSAHADKPSWGGNGKAEKHGQKEKYKDQKGREWDRNEGSFHNRDMEDQRRIEYFGDRHRTIVYDYYFDQFLSGNCPPGLAKKHNGCMPPGQARKWAIGRPLPRDVIYYDLPPSVLMQLGPPLDGYRYARVATDILLIQIGTGLVVDAIRNLGWH